MPSPVFWDSIHAAKDAEQGSHRGAGAVRVIPAIDGKDHGTFEIPIAIEQAQHHKPKVCRRLEPAEIRTVLHQTAAGGFPVQPLVITIQDQPDASGNAAAGRNFREADSNQFSDVRNHERCTFHGSGEEFRIGAFSHTVIHAGILQGIPDGDVRAAGRQAGPYFRADPGSVGMFPVVLILSGQGRQKPGFQIGFANAVFVPMGSDVADPVFSQDLCVQIVWAVFFHGKQPDQLQIQIIIGQWLAAGRNKSPDILHFRFAFIRRSHGAADVLADPAGVDPIFQYGFAEFHFLLSFRMVMFCMNDGNRQIRNRGVTKSFDDQINKPYYIMISLTGNERNKTERKYLLLHILSSFIHCLFSWCFFES